MGNVEFNRVCLATSTDLPWYSRLAHAPIITWLTLVFCMIAGFTSVTICMQDAKPATATIPAISEPVEFVIDTTHKSVKADGFTCPTGYKVIETAEGATCVEEETLPVETPTLKEINEHGSNEPPPRTIEKIVTVVVEKEPTDHPDPTMGFLQICFGQSGTPAILNQASNIPTDKDAVLACPKDNNTMIIIGNDSKIDIDKPKG